MNVFPHFDRVKGVAIDTMHGVYEGVTKMLMTLWFHTIDELLLSIRPPAELSKDIRSLSKDLSYWKGII